MPRFQSSLLFVIVSTFVAGCSGAEPAPPETSDEALTEPMAAVIDVPWVSQNPELPRGCEVTSLTMLLQHAGVAIDKMTLAAEVRKVPWIDGGPLQGDPYTGFVGSMTDLREKGYGVYHTPIKVLAEHYLPGRVVDLTGASFDDLLGEHVAAKRPLWVIVNATWKPLVPDQFATWQTASGPAGITWHEHSVVVTGFDATTVTINDPLDPHGKNKRLGRADFRAAWEQMGRQAITYLPPAAPSEPALRDAGNATCAALAAKPATARLPTELAPFDLTASHAIALVDLRPGDILNRNTATPSAQASAVFAGWADPTRTVACVSGADGATAYDRRALAELTPIRAEAGGLRSAPIGPSCSVHGDGRLYCENDAGAALLASTSSSAAEVNHLRTAFSWFECWSTGELHAGGNTTWYRTIGDDNPSSGWVAAVHLQTTRDFDADPTAHGLPHCAP